MDSEDLIVLRSEAAFAPPAARPAAGSSKRLLGVLAMSALFSVAVLVLRGGVLVRRAGGRIASPRRLRPGRPDETLRT